MGNEENKISGDSSSRFRASGREAVRENVAVAFDNARHSVSVYSPLLDPANFNQSRVIEALAKFCSGGRPNKARILVGHGDEMIRSNSRVADLARRFSDFIDIRQLNRDGGIPSDMFIVIDRDRYLHQPDSEKAECIVGLSTSHELGALSRRFEQLWERSEPVAGLHTLGLGR